MGFLFFLKELQVKDVSHEEMPGGALPVQKNGMMNHYRISVMVPLRK